MVSGLDVFRAHFAGFNDRYVLIGGTACDLALSSSGLAFRATKDLDIVLCLETMDAEFARAFWAFVGAGGYAAQETGLGEQRFYRFRKPTAPDYPAMLELFSRRPDVLGEIKGHLTPIPVGEEVPSLSAILVDDDYYRWVQDGRIIIDGVAVVRPEHLIPLKAKAWLDLTDRVAGGGGVDAKDIRKHKNDVFRLYAAVDPEYAAASPESIREDMSRFIESVRGEAVDLKALGLPNTDLSEVLDALGRRYVVTG